MNKAHLLDFLDVGIREICLAVGLPELVLHALNPKMLRPFLMVIDRHEEQSFDFKQGIVLGATNIQLQRIEMWLLSSPFRFCVTRFWSLLVSETELYQIGEELDFGPNRTDLENVTAIQSKAKTKIHSTDQKGFKYVKICCHIHHWYR